MPSVARMRNPSSWNRRTIGTTVGLSESLTVTNTAPRSGRLPSAAICALANAIPKLSAKPIASPVDRISGPKTVSTLGSLVKGKTASFTATPGTGSSSARSNSSRDRPTMTAAASRANGTPVALLTNGTVRDALGLTSST